MPILVPTPEGDFKFEVKVDKSSNEVSLKVFKGAFKFEQTVQVDNDGNTDAGTVNVTSDAVDMAVVTGYYDRMQDILAKVGFGDLVTDQSSNRYGQLDRGTEQFDLFDGDGSLSSSYEDMSALFQDNDGDGEADINNYDIVFINCGASEQYISSPKGAHQHSHEEFAKSVSKNLSKADIAAVQSFVQNGGTLYATDLAYDYAEQSLPSYVDFYDDDTTPASDPEQWNIAQKGTGGITTDATVLDSDLETWLGNVSCKSGNCLNSDQTVHVEDFLGGWSVINGFHTQNNTKAWIEGPVEWSGGTVLKPLTVSFQAGSGKVLFSSLPSSRNLLLNSDPRNAFCSILYLNNT
ncbi:MAG: hypothetical protein U5J95_03095 [Balneolaceae bacterium]|nr:hypothetical protein [Balneolaceae bacterium]